MQNMVATTIGIHQCKFFSINTAFTKANTVKTNVNSHKPIPSGTPQ